MTRAFAFLLLLPGDLGHNLLGRCSPPVALGMAAVGAMGSQRTVSRIFERSAYTQHSPGEKKVQAYVINTQNEGNEGLNQARRNRPRGAVLSQSMERALLLHI